MLKPVQTIDGYVFEEEIITNYLKKNNMNPITKTKLESNILVPNLILQ